MDISIITVTWNSQEHIADQIRSVISASQGLEYEQIIVDNNSADKTVVIIKEKFPSVKIIANSKNVGFAVANNQGYKEARGEFLLFLNPDNKFIEPGSIKKWVEWMRAHPRVGISGCNLVDSKNNFNGLSAPRRFPTIFDQILILLKIPHIFPSVLNKYLYNNFDPNKEQVVDSVRGGCMLARRDNLDKLGWAFDPRYHIWFEDVDLCREAKRQGYEVMYTPVVAALDMVGQSFKKRNIFWKQFQFTRSMIKYFWKWGF